jgi:hypothetical protein
MADVKISALPAATTPVAGTEVLPIVQSSTTKKVAISDLTAGRAVSAASLTLTTTPLGVASGGTGLTSLTAGRIPYGAGVSGTDPFGSSANLFWDAANSRLGIGTSSPATILQISAANTPRLSIIDTTNNVEMQVLSDNTAGYVGTQTNHPIIFVANVSERMRITSTGTVNIVGAGTAGSTQAVSFNGSAPINSMVLDASGRLGIGTSSPSQPLTINDSGSALNRDFAIRNGDATNFHQIAIGYNAGVSSSGVPQFSPFILAEKGGGYAAVGGLSLGTIGAAPVVFINNGAETARIDSSGNLLVGTTSSPTSGTQCLTIETGTAATASPADTITIYSTDLSAGNTMLSIYTEGTAVGTGTPVADRTIAVRINGTVYYLLASTIP